MINLLSLALSLCGFYRIDSEFYTYFSRRSLDYLVATARPDPTEKPVIPHLVAEKSDVFL